MHVLALFDLSINVSVPTSRRPMADAGTLYFSRRDWVAVIKMELMSSSSDTYDMFCCPRPYVDVLGEKSRIE